MADQHTWLIARQAYESFLDVSIDPIAGQTQDPCSTDQRVTAGELRVDDRSALSLPNLGTCPSLLSALLRARTSAGLTQKQISQIDVAQARLLVIVIQHSPTAAMIPCFSTSLLSMSRLDLALRLTGDSEHGCSASAPSPSQLSWQS